MLPILRILPVGGVLLAILILVLALSPPDGSRAPLSERNGDRRGVFWPIAIASPKCGNFLSTPPSSAPMN